MITAEQEKQQKLAFAKRLRRLRRLNDLSQKEAAEAIGVPLARYGNWEQGRTVPSLAIIPQIADLFHITVDELLGVTPREVEESLIKKLGHLNAHQRKALSNLLSAMFPENHRDADEDTLL